MHIWTRAQRVALRDLYLRTVQEKEVPTVQGYRAFRRTATYSHMNGCILVLFANMIIGIENDGYTHS